MNQDTLLSSPDTDLKRIGEYLIFLNKILGKGHYGTVYLAFKIEQLGSGYDKLEGISLKIQEPLACKIIERDLLCSEASRLVENELKNLKQVRCSKVLKLVEQYKTH